MSEQNTRGGVKREFDQAKKFMRYVLPGLVFSVLMGLAFWVSPLSNSTDGLGKAAMNWNVSQGIIAVIGVILSSGALGYIFSNIYHSLGKLLDINYGSILLQLHRNPNIMIVKECGCTYSINNLKEAKKKDALVVANQIWMFSSGMHSGFSELEKYAARNADMLHGMGATIVGAIIGLGFWVYMTFGEFDYINGYWVACLLVWGALLTVLICEYWKFRNFAYSYCRSALLSGVSSLSRDKLMNKIYMISYKGF